MSTKNAGAVVRRKLLNGFNGSPPNWIDIPQEKPICRSARMKHIAAGNRKPARAFAFPLQIAEHFADGF
jgi:hypothetical protein